MQTKASLIILFLLPLFSLAQSHESKEGSHDSEHEKHPGIIEIITTGTSVFPAGEDLQLFGSEVHLTYWFNHSYGTGLSYTLKFEGEDNTSDIAFLASWNPTQWVTLNLGPNIALPNEHREAALLAYAEAEINWRLKKWFHLGPVVGTLLGRQSELTIGFHIGFEFDNPFQK